MTHTIRANSVLRYTDAMNLKSNFKILVILFVFWVCILGDVGGLWLVFSVLCVGLVFSICVPIYFERIWS